MGYKGSRIIWIMGDKSSQDKINYGRQEISDYNGSVKIMFEIGEVNRSGEMLEHGR